MSIMKLILISMSVLYLAAYSSEGHSAQSLKLSESLRIAQKTKIRPIRVQGEASVSLMADRLSVYISVTANADSIDGIIERLQERRSDISGKAGAADLSVISTEIRSVRINKSRGDGPGYKGEMQLGVKVAGFGDPLVAIGQIADDKVTRISNLRYGFSADLLKQHDLCTKALANAREKAEKRANAAGRKIGKLLEHTCSDAYQRLGQFSSEPTKQISTSVNASFEQIERTDL